MKLANTRTFPGSKKTLAFLVAAALSACSADTGDQPEDGLGDEVSGDGIAGDVTDKAGDSYVEWCNLPGPYFGTICRQQGCEGIACYSRETPAVIECRDEVRRICGSGVQRWFIVFKGDGKYYPL